MKTKKTLDQKTKRNATLFSQNIKVRRCEIKLRRFDGVRLNKNKRVSTKSLLQAQQIGEKASAVNPKLSERIVLHPKSLINKDIPIPKMKKCFVRVKRIHLNSVNLKLTERKTLPQKIPTNMDIPKKKMKKCVVRLKRTHLNSDQNQNVLKSTPTAPIARNPLLALTSRRAKELGLKTNTENSKRQVTFSQTDLEMERSEVQLAFTNTSHKSNSSNERLSRNLGNKPNLITEFLLSEDEDFLTKPTDDQSKIPENSKNQSTVVRKFFHKEHKNMLEDKKLENLKNTIPTNKKRKRKATKRNIKNQRTKTQHKTSRDEKDIYEFFSQSQTSDSDSKKDKDVASDIIKKLIVEGKVAVSKNYKGRPRLKRQLPKRRKNPMTATNKSEKEIDPKNIELDIHDDSDDEQFDHLLSNVQENLEPIQIQPHRKDEVSTANGTFSELARSVLAPKVRNQSEETHKHIADGRTALDILQRYNSTPFKPKNKLPELPVDVGLSPIQIGPNEKSKSQATSNRIMTSSKEPLSFLASNQTLCNDNLKGLDTSDKAMGIFEHPSEDFTSCPGKNKTLSNDKTKGLAHTNKALRFFENSIDFSSQFSDITKTRSDTNKTVNQARAPTSSRVYAQSKSPQIVSSLSFSSNDSNAENQPPSMLQNSFNTQENPETRTDENDVIHSSRQIPNPRRTLPHRSPLKTINIIDVVSLPAYTGPMGIKSKRNENMPNDKNKGESLLFGFEEYLDENEAENGSSLVNEKTKTKSSKFNISKQLHKLKRLHPKETTHLRRTANSTIGTNIFDDDTGKTKGYRNIKEMFCSTMVNNETMAEQQPTYSSSILGSESGSDNGDSDDTISADKSRKKVEAELFGDPETTFDQKSFHRTYERPFRRKRKLMHQFSDMFESDHESSDNEADELNTSVTKEKGRKAKKRQLESPKNEELNKFVSEFNSILKEAEDYELIVE